MSGCQQPQADWTGGRIGHDANSGLPPGYLGVPTWYGPQWGAQDSPAHYSYSALNLCELVYLLPYLEQGNLWQLGQNSGISFDPANATNYVYWPAYGQLYPMASARPSVFQCPSDQLYNDYGGISGGWAYTIGTYDVQLNGAYTAQAYLFADSGYFGRTNYLGVSGARGSGILPGGGAAGKPGSLDPYWGKYAGVFNNDSRTRLTDITDGTSSTLMFGEVLGFIPAGGAARYYAYSWMGGGVVSTNYGLAGPLNTATYGQPASRHGAGVNFVFADGSVHLLNRANTAYNPIGTAGDYSTPEVLPPTSQTGWWVLQQLAGMGDGSTPNTSVLGF